jgi:O-antigen ligase
LFTIPSAVGIGFFGLKAAFAILVLVVGLPLVYAIITYPKLGIIVILISSFFLLWVLKMGINFPLGTLMDAIFALMLFGFFLKQKYRNDWTVFKSPISVVVLIWISYNFLEVINPSADSRLAWVYTVRTVAIVMLWYFIFLYYIQTLQFIKVIFKLWIGLSFFVAAYAFKQEYFGFFPFEKVWLASEPTYTALYYISGHWRIFSIFSDPVTFAYNMIISSILCFSLLTSPMKGWKKAVLVCLGSFFLLTMLYSGTRGAYVLLPVALGMYCILKFNKKVLFFGLILAGIIVVIIRTPSTNPTIQRFQSAFYPSNDASFNVRKNNQKMIQPFILSHPLGGGLGATGMWGERFSPHSFLANFPPDSGYIRVAVELGWLGLLIFCTLMFVVLYTGINNYYKIKDPTLKSYCMAMVLIAFTLNIANFPQEALVQYPTNVYFSLVLALIGVTRLLDQKKEHPDQPVL